jgi:dihydroorotate dehydrogenase (fumarate)
MDLSTRVMGIEIMNPIVVGSSGLTDEPAKIKDLEHQGAGAVVLRSIFEEEIISEYDELMKEAAEKGYSAEFYDYYDYQIRSNRLEQYAGLIREAKRSVDIPVIASVNCIYSHEWVSYSGEIENAGADALELNMFFLPSAASQNQEQDADRFFRIIETVKTKLKIPVAVKMSYYFFDLAATIKRISDMGIDAMVLFNRSFHPDFNIENMRVMPTYVLSSPQDSALPLRWIANMAKRVDCDLIASTGVHDGQAFIKQILAGAKAVQVVSALYKQGIEQIGAILGELQSWMQTHGYETLDQFRGKMSQSESDNPMVHERVQFMKYFGGGARPEA